MMTSSVQKIKRNNPLNIRYSGSPWFGLTGSDNGFCVFSSLAFGYRAAYKLLLSKNYINLSLKDAIFRWCPFGDGDNNPESYSDIVGKIVFGDNFVSCMERYTFKDLSLYRRFCVLSAMTLIETGVYIDPYSIENFLKPFFL